MSTSPAFPSCASRCEMARLHPFPFQKRKGPRADGEVVDDGREWRHELALVSRVVVGVQPCARDELHVIDATVHDGSWGRDSGARRWQNQIAGAGKGAIGCSMG
jgi:hypothetical protein